jgi:organic radical activating enzyme
MHDLEPFIAACYDISLDGPLERINVETSGTIPLGKVVAPLENYGVPHWITVSPKKGCLEESLLHADELKVVIEPKSFNNEQFKEVYGNYLDKTFIQPVNYELNVNMDNLNFCLDLQKQYPQVRISVQAHKFWGVR